MASPLRSEIIEGEAVIELYEPQPVVDELALRRVLKNIGFTSLNSLEQTYLDLYEEARHNIGNFVLASNIADREVPLRTYSWPYSSAPDY